MTRRLLAVALVAASLTPATAHACQPEYCPPQPFWCRYEALEKICPAPVY